MAGVYAFRAGVPADAERLTALTAEGYRSFAPAGWEPPSPGTGLATDLHGAALRAARERAYTTMRLFTPAGQARARRFYEREGWTLRGRPAFEPALALELVEDRYALAR